jgi:NAD(P)-dependent dehydrogenase (short-subunit alcohol dehydrogenase family)
MLVVGAAGGVGLEVARALIQRGDRVIGTVRNEQEEAMLAELEGGLSEVLRLDLADADAVLATLKPFFARTGAVDAVVICAAINPNGPIETESLATVRHTLEVNTLSVLAIYQAALPALRKSRGALVMIGSITGKYAMPFVGTYVVSKFALEGLADIMRREAYPWGVRVVLIQPGGINTPMSRAHVPQVEAKIAALSPEERELYGPLYQGFVERLRVTVPNGAHPSVVAEAIVEVVDLDEPAARYPVGEDAKALAAKLPTLSDADIDEIFRNSYDGALKRRV